MGLNSDFYLSRCEIEVNATQATYLQTTHRTANILARKFIVTAAGRAEIHDVDG